MENKCIHSIRIASDLWLDEKRFNEFLRLLKKYPCEIGQIALFTASTHPPLTIEETQRRIAIIENRMKTIRNAGFSAGINILGTIGHHEEDLKAGLGDKYTYMTGEDGRVCRGSYCMNDESFLREYVVPVYGILAKSHPDFIWIDDDIRYGHMPIGNGCFCDKCISKFNRENNTSHTRESLVYELNYGGLDSRRAWLRHNSGAIINLFKVISATVRGINENIVLGFMTGERYMEGYAFKEFADALSENGKYPIMWRPGGGAYTDYCYGEIVKKAEEAGRQNAYLPENVTIRQYELENFPYQLLKKSPESTALEAAWCMTAGCTGAAFNIVPSETGEPVETIEEHLKKINSLTPFYRLLSEKIEGKQPFGICHGWFPDSQLAVPKGQFVREWGGIYAGFADELFDFGLPQTNLHKNASVLLLKGECIVHKSDEEIRKILSNGIYSDAYALEVLNDRGFGAETGFKVEKEFPVDTRELYNAHPLNAKIEGGLRNCRQAFNFGESFGLVPTGEGAESLSSLTDYHGNTLSEVGLGIFENKLGGRVAVGGYYPFTWVSDYFKTKQLKELMLYLSDNTLPSYVETYCRIRNHSFVGEKGVILALLNPTNRFLENIVVAIKTDAESAKCWDMDCNETSLKAEVRDAANGYRFFSVAAIKPFEMVVIEA